VDDFHENRRRSSIGLARTRGRLRLRLFRYLSGGGENPAGEVVELRCSYDPALAGKAPGRTRVQATLHWVSAPMQYGGGSASTNQLFTLPTRTPPTSPRSQPRLPPHSEVLKDCGSSPRLRATEFAEPVQFERQGYFCRIRTRRPASSCSTVTVRPARYLGKGEHRNVGGLGCNQPRPAAASSAAIRSAIAAYRQTQPVRRLSAARSGEARAQKIAIRLRDRARNSPASTK